MEDELFDLKKALVMSAEENLTAQHDDAVPPTCNSCSTAAGIPEGARNEDNPLVSIVVPLYNARDWVDGCISMLTRQTYRNLEIILVNDGSVDGSDFLCEQWTLRERRIKCIHKTNGGPSSARNAGFAASSGEWIWFVDVDDYVIPRAVETFVDSCARRNADVAICDFAIESGGRSLQRESLDLAPFPSKEHDDAEGLLENIFSRSVGTYTWQFFIKRGLLDSFRRSDLFDEDIVLYEDVVFSLELASRARFISYVGDQVYRYRLNPTSIVHRVDPEVAGRALKAIDYLAGLDIPRHLEKERLRMQCSLLLGLGMAAGIESGSRAVMKGIGVRARKARRSEHYKELDAGVRVKCLLANLHVYWWLRRLRDRLKGMRHFTRPSRAASGRNHG